MSTVADELVDGVDVTTVDASIAPATAAAPPVTKPKPADEGPYSAGDPEYGDADLPEESGEVKPVESVTPAAKAAEAAPAEKPPEAEKRGEPAKPAAEKTIEKPAAESPADEPVFDDGLLAEAARYGFTKAEAEAFASPAALQRAMTAIDRRELAQARGEQAAPKDGAAAPAAAPAPAKPAAPATPAAPAPAPGATAAGAAAAFEKLKLDLDPEQYDPGFIKIVNGINDHYAGIVNTLHQSNQAFQSELAQVTQRFKQEEGQRFEQEMDLLIETTTPAPLKEIFGTGSMRSLVATNAAQAKARSEIVGQMLELNALDVKAGRQPSSMQQLFQRALRTLHSDKLEIIARDKVRGEVSERRSQTISRPSSREAKATTPEQKAAQRANEFYKSKGYEVPEMGDADLDDGV